MTPTKIQAIKIPAGPPLCKAEPEPTNKPVPMEPPMAIICKCLDFNDLFNGDLAAIIFAFSISDKFGSRSSKGIGLNESLKSPNHPFPDDDPSVGDVGSFGFIVVVTALSEPLPLLSTLLDILFVLYEIYV
ncbi:unnamed protein product [Ambrosiozyma monospora]|uniref:Unnamed protein product n=1 Tax=Ambrosiozyma monospora TaxID=43982 RepID=A0ACB5TAI1_AMBMO|nr:unnamed protein product [Ambrosiozyma monospora]